MATSSPPKGPDVEPETTAGHVSASHELLFVPETPRCDACDGPLAITADEGEGEGDVITGGHGLYVWSRHGELVFEEPPLCGACAAAITISALQRWEIEEEEG
jgi:hypothetical protein